MPLLLYPAKRKTGLGAAAANIILQYDFSKGSGSNVTELVSKSSKTLTALSNGELVWDNAGGRWGIKKPAANSNYSTAAKLSGNIDISGDYSTAVWFRSTGWNDNLNGGSAVLFELSSSNGTCTIYRDGYSSDGRLYTQGATLIKNPTGPMTVYNSPSLIVWSRSGNVVSIYINGVLITSGTVPALTITGTYQMLPELRQMSNWFTLYSTTVFNKALSATDVQSLLQLGHSWHI